MKVKFIGLAIAFWSISLPAAETSSAREANLGLGKQVAISYVGGFGGAMLGGMVGSLAYRIAATEEQKERDKAYHDEFYISPGVVYFFMGTAIGYPVGSATLLHLNDRSSSFPWMVAATLGTELAVTGIVALAGHYDDPTLVRASLWGYLLVPLATVIAFNQTRKGVPRYGDALLEIQDGKLILYLPKVIVERSSSQSLGFTLVKVKF